MVDLIFYKLTHKHSRQHSFIGAFSVEPNYVLNINK
ncbi:hypothetical protein EV690_2066 [Celerinatantimonas diazotrophica]|uniref:Uncharacterized protein n=1 Tax=Celerinatantimonas diazotrophica TaxID=412034 RepID=A0A4R1JLZ7_9GAMM|nr:hypothetical protein EV690_2066 [Celerinatantimonas diazotrophica]CAG9296329.1 hypothetical protein CEDIAZO_01477 [Celerinatantimonas diazotrophica]